MKGFFQSLLGSLTAFIILGFCCIVLFIAFVVALVNNNGVAMVAVEPDSVLVLDLNMTIQDAPPIADFEDALREVMGGGFPVTYVLKVVDAIQRAEADDDIRAIFMHGSLLQEGYGSGLAAVSEIRKALEDFKNSGKPVYAYLVDPSQKDYYLASVADQIWLNPFGMLSLNGLATNAPFLGGTFEKYGIGVQTTRVGAYKSAVEMFTRESMSDADREQTVGLLNDIWRSLLAEISNARKVELQALAQLSEREAFFNASDALAAKLVDRVGYLDELIDFLSSTYEYSEEEESFQQIALLDYANARGFELDSTANFGERVAVVYAEGDIVDGGDFLGYIGGDWLAYELRRLRNDDEVKAVVLRVNSPGGSAVASEIIQRETRLLAAKKPLIVSMGSYAASGGYWISAYADKIYAQPYTITGSIGVFGLVFNVKEAAANFAVQFDGVKTAPFADIYSVTRPRTKDEMALIQKFTDEIYDAFIDRVAEGRSIHKDAVREVAQGRVWTGLSAKEHSLIDAFGGLDTAIAEAFSLVDLEYYTIEQVPSPATLADTIALMLEKPGAPPVAKSTSPVGQLSNQVEAVTHKLRALNDPRSVYARMPYVLEDL